MVYSPCRNERLSCEGGKAASVNRRDKKNRILHSGESQTKDGRLKSKICKEMPVCAGFQ